MQKHIFRWKSDFGKSDGLQRSNIKGVIANGLNVGTQRKRCETFAACKGMFSNQRWTIDDKRVQGGATFKGRIADGSDALWNGDARQ